MANKKWYEKVVKTAEDLGWTIYRDDELSNCWEFEKFSPAGEDFSFTVYAKNLTELKEELQSYYDYFDREDHTFELLEAKRNGFRGVPDLDTLVQDSQDIEDMLEELAVEVTKIK